MYLIVTQANIKETKATDKFRLDCLWYPNIALGFEVEGTISR